MGEEAFFEIVLFLAERFSDAYPQKWELDEATGFLRELGYDSSEIKRAMSWFFLQVEPEAHEVKPASSRRSSGGFRVLSPQEMSRITPEAYGYLIELKRLGIIDDDGLENVLENAMGTGQDRVDKEELIRIVNRVIHGIGDEDIDRAR
jgi:uncharacterized protein Smg (DUF494 family)